MARVRARLVSLWLPVVAWAAVIFVFSSIPSLNTGLGGWDTALRKGAHMSEFAILAVLLWRAVGSGVGSTEPPSSGGAGFAGAGAKIPELPALGLAIAYAVSDEIHQLFVRGRHGSPVDVAIDTAGILIGLALLRLARGSRLRGART
jgi:VanZ family protein